MLRADAGSGSDYQSGTPRGTGATGTGSNYDTDRNQGAALTSGNVRSHIPGEQGSDRRGQQVCALFSCLPVGNWVAYLLLQLPGCIRQDSKTKAVVVGHTNDQHSFVVFTARFSRIAGDVCHLERVVTRLNGLFVCLIRTPQIVGIPCIVNNKC